MAEEQVSGHVQGPNGERLSLTVGGKSIGLQARDLLPILLLIGGLTGGYLLYTAVDHDLEQLYTRQQSILDQLHAMDEQRIQQTIRLHHLLSTHEYNQGRPPEDRLPLVLDPPIQSTPRER